MFTIWRAEIVGIKLVKHKKLFIFIIWFVVAGGGDLSYSNSQIVQKIFVFMETKCMKKSFKGIKSRQFRLLLS